MIEKSKYSKNSLMEAIGTLRKLVKRDDFDTALNSLGLIDLGKDDAKLTSDREILMTAPHREQTCE